MTLVEERDADVRTGWIRLAIGFVQGLCAWGLIEAADTAFATGNPQVFAALAVLVGFPPMIVLAALGRMRPRTLIVWTLSAALVLVLLVAYDLWRQPVEPYGTDPRIWPSPQLLVFAAAALFIGHHLIEPADQEQRRLASYRGLFECASRHAFQLVLSLAFTLVFWGVLQLGSALFRAIGIEALATLLRQTWFVAPATATAFAAAVHLTDVRPALIRGVRTVGLALLSWLLPLMAGLAALFLAALLFTGVGPLWETRMAGASLLTAAAAMIILINAVYQDGLEPETRPLALRWAARAAAVLLVPMVALAAWASGLRIGQYGLTPERIGSLYVIAVAAVLAGGYAWAAAERLRWMKRIEAVNVVAALAACAAILLFFAPLLDPARLSVADQVRRLQAGRTAPDAFDYDFLRFDSARFGRAALEKLAASDKPAIAEPAREALARNVRQAPAERVDADGKPPFSAATVKPDGAVLPESFRRQDFAGLTPQGADCLTGGAACTLYLMDVTGDGAPEVLAASREPFANLDVFAGDGDGWRRIGRYEGFECEGAPDALEAGGARLVQPLARDLQVGGLTLRFTGNSGCEPVKAAAGPTGGAERPKPPPAELGPAFNRP